MLRVRLSVSTELANDVVAKLVETDGVAGLVRLPVEGRSGGVVLMADVTPGGADRVIDLIAGLGRGTRDFVVVREDVISTPQLRPAVLRSANDFGWVEILGQARANSRPFARYLVLISVAAVIAALGC